jgi:hypothetical protein
VVHEGVELVDGSEILRNDVDGSYHPLELVLVLALEQQDTQVVVVAIVSVPSCYERARSKCATILRVVGDDLEFGISLNRCYRPCEG